MVWAGSGSRLLVFTLSLAWERSSLPVGPVQTRLDGCKVWVSVWVEASSLAQAGCLQS